MVAKIYHKATDGGFEALPGTNELIHHLPPYIFNCLLPDCFSQREFSFVVDSYETEASLVFRFRVF